jgi:hypothetical protein
VRRPETEPVIRRDLFRRRFAAGVFERTAQVVAAGQRPIILAALQQAAAHAAHASSDRARERPGTAGAVPGRAVRGTAWSVSPDGP